MATVFVDAKMMENISQLLGAVAYPGDQGLALHAYLSDGGSLSEEAATLKEEVDNAISAQRTIYTTRQTG